MNLEVFCPNGLSNYWDGNDFVFVYRNQLYAMKKTDEWYPEMIAKLLNQNNCSTLEEFNSRYQKHFNIKNI